MRFPTRFPVAALTAARRALAAALLVCLAWALPARSQSAFDPIKTLASLQIQAPWSGPGAALFNPAHISETRVLYVRADRFQSISGKAGRESALGAVGLPFGVKAGLSSFREGQAIDGASAVYQEYQMTPMAGWGGDTRGGFHLGFAAAVPFRGMNAFNAVKSRTHGLDLGATIHFPDLGPDLGRIRFAFGAQNLIGGDVDLPDGRGVYEAHPAAWDASGLWTGLGGVADVYLDQKLQRRAGGTKEEMLWAYGAEVRPIPDFGVKLERTWRAYWVAGARGNVPVGGGVLGLDFNLAHDRLSADGRDEGRGLLWSLGADFSY